MIETNYELFAVVIHKGTCYSGHYYGYIKDIDQIGTWIRPSPPPPPSTVRYLSSKLSIMH
jgi:ubiquitin carboxyl-terminal hydrolase 40